MDNLQNDPTLKKGREDFFLAVGLYLIGLLFWAIAVSTFLMIFKFSIGPLHIVFTVLLNTLVTPRFLRSTEVRTVPVAVSSLLILFGVVWLSLRFYDPSWDGNNYHKCIVGFMKNGWNPLYETFYSFAEKNFPPMTAMTETWNDSYTKGSEIWGACLYALCGNIEAGKSFNLLSITGAFLICCALLAQTKALRPWQAALVTAVCVFNPISVSQCFTYYVDAFLWQMVLICLAAMTYLTLYKNGKYSTVCKYLIFLSINIGFNIKLSGLIFFAIPCLTFFVFWCIRAWRTGLSAEVKRTVRNLFLLFAGSVISGLVFTGATAYVTNLIRYKNPVYTMIGPGSSDIMTPNMPYMFREMSSPVRVVTSLFSILSNDWAATCQWKIPLFFYEGEVTTQRFFYDVRISGWGILFSGIFLIGIAVLAVALFKSWKHRASAPSLRFSLTCTLLAVLTVSICFVPSMWWARYNCALFYLPAAALCWLFVKAETAPSSSGKMFLAGIIVAFCFINIVPCLEYLPIQWSDCNRISNELDSLKTDTGDQPAAVCLTDTHSTLYGKLFALEDYGIPYTFSPTLLEGEISGSVYDDILYQLPGAAQSSSALLDRSSDINLFFGLDGNETVDAEFDNGNVYPLSELLYEKYRPGLEEGDYIVWCYNNILGRTPDNDEIQWWTSYFQEGHSDQDIIIVFLESDEFQGMFS